MNLKFLEQPLEERRVYLEQAALRRDMSPVILEKDFWVCWLLGILFRSEFADAIVFKGGTSLSKVFGVIDRFSEDIDLSVSPAFLKLPEAGSSRNQVNKWMKVAEEVCSEAVQNRMTPVLESTATKILGPPQTEWFEFRTDTITKSPVLLFHYPTTQPPGFEYLKRSVKLEFGSLTDQQPTGRYPVRAWVAETFPGAFPDWECGVVALELDRSFWEKATILHTEYHRPSEKPTPDRFSRHYADTAALARHPQAQAAIGKPELRDRVVTWKQRFFASAWAGYELARPGTFRLVPPEDRRADLRRDYEAMRPMYISEPLEFDAVMAALTELETRINEPTD